MPLVLSTNEFKVDGVTYAGFPIILDSEMRSVQHANAFLRFYLLHRGHIRSRKTWATYGHHMSHFISFLERNALSWKADPLPGRPSIAAAYRNSCLADGTSATTINQRLSTIIQFYNYALRNEWIEVVPFAMESHRSGPNKTFLAHLDKSGGRRAVADIKMKVFRRPASILSPQQIRALLEVLVNPSHKLMARLALQVGLRREEIASFPAAYVRDTDGREAMCLVALNPRDCNGMKTKGAKPRDVWMPAELMRRLWEYKVHIRPSKTKSEQNHPQLFLNTQGLPWSDDGRAFTATIRRAGKKAGFDVWPHMLRHTYASYTLAAMQRTSRGIDPIVFLQRQLGHSSVHTTMEYLHIVDQLVEQAVTSFDQEVSAWSTT